MGGQGGKERASLKPSVTPAVTAERYLPIEKSSVSATVLFAKEVESQGLCRKGGLKSTVDFLCFVKWVGRKVGEEEKKKLRFHIVKRERTNWDSPKLYSLALRTFFLGVWAFFISPIFYVFAVDFSTFSPLDSYHSRGADLVHSAFNRIFARTHYRRISFGQVAKLSAVGLHVNLLFGSYGGARNSRYRVNIRE